MLVAASSIEDAIARANRRAQLPGNVGRNWSEEEEAAKVAAHQSGDSVSTIAARHGRTVRAIEARLERMGLITARQRTTGNSFAIDPNKEDK
jgi:transposase-like protein